MLEVPITLPAALDWTAAILIIESCCLDARLLVIQRGTLAKYPGCTHWHFKRPKEKGTLELTVWPDAGRAWFILRANRRDAWMDTALATLIPTIEAGLASLVRDSNSAP